MLLTDYLYVLPEHPIKKSEVDFQYLSVKKINKYFDFKVGEKIFLLYRKSKTTAPGIIGFCYVAGQPVRVRDICKEKRYLCYNRSFWQLPVKDIQCGIKNIISEEILYSLPLLNEYRKRRVFAECSMIQTFRLEDSLIDRSKYWYVWRSSRTKKVVDEYNHLYVHKSREEFVTNHRIYYKLSKGISKCSHCGVKHDEYLPYTLPFFEFHETITPQVSTKYRKIDFNNFIALCPNCHKKIHERMISQPINHKKFGYHEFDSRGLYCGWNEDYFRNNTD